MDTHDWLAGRFRAHRDRLRGIAYRILGSPGVADDAVQETWLCLARTGAASVENLGGWLTTVVARVCLDMLRSRKSRREAPIDADAPHPAASGARATDPEHVALLALLDPTSCSAPTAPTAPPSTPALPQSSAAPKRSPTPSAAAPASPARPSSTARPARCGRPAGGRGWCSGLRSWGEDCGDRDCGGGGEGGAVRRGVHGRVKGVTREDAVAPRRFSRRLARWRCARVLSLSVPRAILSIMIRTRRSYTRAGVRCAVRLTPYDDLNAAKVDTPLAEPQAVSGRAA